MKRILYTVVFAIWLPVFLFGQKVPVRVLDARTGNAVAFAHVKATETGAKQSKYFVTDFDGKISLTIEKPTIIQVTYVGYQEFKDTLLPGKSGDIRLLPEIFSLDEVVVTAQYNPTSTDRSLYNVKVIN